MEYGKYQKGFKFIKSNDDIIIRDIKEYFEEPKIYLKQNKRIIIGKSLLKNLQNSNYIINGESKKQSNNESNNNKSNIMITNKKNEIRRHSVTEIYNKRPLSVGIHYKYKTVNEILNSYKEGKVREEKEKQKGTDKYIPENVKTKIKTQYLSQEKNLKKLFLENEKDKELLNYLSKKCNTKKENLLFNKTEDYRIKNQLLDYIENNKNLYEKFGNYCWYINLRRPNLLKKARDIYINRDIKGKTQFEPIVDFTDNHLEIIKKAEKPYEMAKSYEKIFKYNNLPKNKNEKNKFQKKKKYKLFELNDINNIIIKGKNLIAFEQENFLKYDLNKNHKYRVFKDPREENYKCSKNFIYKENYSFRPRRFKTENK